jgi:hypothetical protein
MSKADDAKRLVSESLSSGIDKAVQISRPALVKHIAASRRHRPDATPGQVIDALGRRFTATVASTGAAAGATAAAPGISTPVSLALAAGDATTFTGVAALFVFALAEIHEIPIQDLERRRTLLMGVLLGEVGADVVQKTAGRTGAHWAKKVVAGIPAESIRQINRFLGPNFVTRYGTRQGILVLGKQVPFGIGGAIGGAGNAVFAQATIRSAKRAFGPPPEVWPEHLAIEADG